MIKLTYLLRRRPDLSESSFLSFWQSNHANLTQSLAATLNAKRYSMAPKVETTCNACVSSARGLQSNQYDGVLEIYWDSIEDYQSGVGSAQGIAAVDALIDAEKRFIDFSRSTAFFVKEHIVFDETRKSLAARQSA